MLCVLFLCVCLSVCVCVCVLLHGAWMAASRCVWFPTGTTPPRPPFPGPHLRGTAPIFALFPSRRKFHLFLLSLGSWNCGRDSRPNSNLSAFGLLRCHCVQHRRRVGSSHKMTQEKPQMRTLGGPRPRTAATIERARKERNLCQEMEKREILGLPLLGLPPFGPVFSGFCSPPRMSQLGQKLMTTNVGLSRTKGPQGFLWPKSNNGRLA